MLKLDQETEWFMKNFFIFVVIILALLSIDHPTIKEPREKLFEQVTGKLSDSTKLQKESLAKDVRIEITETVRLREKERIHIEETTTSDDKVIAWHKRYCEQRDLNPFFYGDKLRQVCQIMANRIKRN